MTYLHQIRCDSCGTTLTADPATVPIRMAFDGWGQDHERQMDLCPTCAGGGDPGVCDECGRRFNDENDDCSTLHGFSEADEPGAVGVLVDGQRYERARVDASGDPMEPAVRIWVRPPERLDAILSDAEEARP